MVIDTSIIIYVYIIIYILYILETIPCQMPFETKNLIGWWSGANCGSIGVPFLEHTRWTRAIFIQCLRCRRPLQLPARARADSGAYFSGGRPMAMNPCYSFQRRLSKKHININTRPFLVSHCGWYIMFGKCLPRKLEFIGLNNSV